MHVVGKDTKRINSRVVQMFRDHQIADEDVGRIPEGTPRLLILCIRRDVEYPTLKWMKLRHGHSLQVSKFVGRCRQIFCFSYVSILGCRMPITDVPHPYGTGQRRRRRRREIMNIPRLAAAIKSLRSSVAATILGAPCHPSIRPPLRDGLLRVTYFNQVPSFQLPRYFFCSAVSSSIPIPIVVSCTAEMWSSISGGRVITSAFIFPLFFTRYSQASA